MTTEIFTYIPSSLVGFIPHDGNLLKVFVRIVENKGHSCKILAPAKVFFFTMRMYFLQATNMQLP
jgi:hypothetical protein